MEPHYAALPHRIKAAIIDGIIIIVAMYGIVELFAFFETIPTYLRIMAWISIFILYEPLLVSRFSGTVGHMYVGLIIKREDNPLKNISFPLAIVRFIVKVCLGWISFLTISANTKRKAIHDFAAGSIVLEQNNLSKPSK